MQRKPLFWFLLSLLCLGGAIYFWQLGNKWQAQKNARHPSAANPATNNAASNTAPHEKSSGATPLIAKKSNPSASTNAAANAVAAKKPYPYRLSNTDEKVGKLVHNDHAVLLANALIDTGKPVNLAIPNRLRAPADNGSYVVQSRGPLNDQFRAVLQNANATIVSYIPNNAYLVRVSDTGAQQISADAQTQSVLPFEPYYKLDVPLLKLAMEQPDQLPPSGKLNLTLFADAAQQTIAQLQQLGAEVTAQDRSPFGPLVTVVATPGTLSQIASLPGVQGVSTYHPRLQANDLDRPRLNVAADSITATNYLGLSGTNVLININDGGVDAQHPDLKNRLTSDFAFNLVDTDGHGTHVAGTIMGTGMESATVATNPPGSVLGANFRGMAPNADGFVMSIYYNVDSYLQETAARTNCFISNNSWNYGGAYGYDIAAASYDAAVRDALPEVPGSQPLLYVFSAGNDGGGYDDGTGGLQDTILSPATAKNVITVGAIEQPRYITNLVIVDGVTNQEIYNATDNAQQVASFSSRGNVGIQVEGDFGRFKPDVVAPGTFVISCASTEWDTNGYYNPVHTYDFTYPNNTVQTNTTTPFLVSVPSGAFRIIITLETNQQTGATTLPSMPIYVADNDFPVINASDMIGTNKIVLPTNSPTSIPVNPGDTIYFNVGNNWTNTINFNVDIKITYTNDDGDYWLVLSNLNNPLAPYYRYESGTSMAAAGVSGMLALMQEFFQKNLGVTNSPALMKALLINGARSVSDQYDFATRDQSTPTLQGWGLPSLPNSIPPALSNVTASTLSQMPLQFYDQSPTNALATGQSMVYNLTLTPAASAQDLRVTLVWTDPPGNPAAGVKLVNDLDLIVSNVDTKEVFFGNDIPIGSTYNQAWDTNGAPNIDSVNNVENVFLPGPLGTNYTITVLGRRVNVNAVTANTNGIVQDYALVVSSGDAGSATATFTLTPANNGAIFTNNAVSNVMVLSNGVPTLNQRVGANSQYSGSTNGTASQWNFYVYTNTPSLTNANFTNVAFITFLPPSLGVPRMGASTEVGPPDPNATRYAGADIDLYVSSNPALTNLDTNVLAICPRSVGRLGNEVVYFTNSTPGQVYYIGVKSEDQQAAQFDLIGFATDTPFSQQDTNGNTIVNMQTVPLVIPGGSPTAPSSVTLFGVCIQPVQVRKVVVTNTVICQDFGDYVGSLSEGNTAAVLNNHSFFTNVNDAYETLVYDDSGEGEFPNAQTSAGPGSLRSFVGVNALASAWIFTMVNDSSPTDTGTISNMTLRLEPQSPPNSGYHHLPPLAANAWYYGYVDVPANATNMILSIAGNTGPIDLLVQYGSFPSFASYEKWVTVPTPGGSLSISKYDNPPLNAGRYFFAIHTHNAEAQLELEITLQYSLAAQAASRFLSVGNEALLDDAVTYSTNHVSANSTVVSAEVGVRINHPRESDLVLTLISPLGTRVLLAENRGGTDTNGYGSGTNIVIGTAASSGGAAYFATNINVGANSGIINVTYNMYTIPDEMAIFYDGAKIFDSGMVSGTRSFSIPFGPGTSQYVQIVMNPYGNSATNGGDLWDYTATIEAQTMSYAVFSENTNITQTPIKFAVPPFGSGPPNLPQVTVMSNGFEGIAAGTYTNTIPFGGGSPNFWTVTATNPAIPTPPTVVTAPALAAAGGDGSNVLALHGGTISCVLPTIAGYQYVLTFANHGRPALTPVSWWKADSTTSDSADGNNLVDLFGNQVLYTNGVVGQAFLLQGNTKLNAPDAPNLVLTNAITIEGWVSPQNANTSSIVNRGDNRPGYDPYTLGVGPPTTGGQCDLQWQVTDTNGNSAVLFGPLSFNVFAHVAGTYSWNTINGTNSTNATLSLYINGQLVATTNTTVRPIGALISNMGPGIGVGNVGDAINDFAFTGLLDEITLYSNSLSAVQVQDIYAAGSAGKDPVGETPPVTAQVIFGGATNIIAGIDEWDSQSYQFTATSNNMVLTFVPNQDGMLLDSIQLLQIPQPNPANYYLPEESLDKLVGENALGDWQLEVLDNRVGATNPQPVLVSWQLSLQLTDKTPYAIPLSEGMTQTNSVAPGSITYFSVTVPAWAKFATNLISASGPVNLLFDQTVPPTGTNANDYFLLNNQSSGMATLRTTGNPPLLPDETYYLGVQNTGTGAVTFSIQVDFDITTLTNMVPYTNATIVYGNVPRYFQFDVDTNAVLGIFQILNPTGNLELVASKGVPLPDMTNFDYISAEPGTNTPQTIMVLTNSQPVPMGPGRWYLGVFNNALSNVNYTIKASEVGPPNIIPLTNGVPLRFTSVPGPALTNFFVFSITNTNSAALFELYNLTGNVDLTLQRSNIPYAPPYFATSSNPGTNNEQIVIRTNLLGTNINGLWYLGVPNNAPFNVSYTIRAVVSTNGMLPSGVPLQVKPTLPSSGATSGLTLTWTGVAGETYEVQASSDLVTWNTIATVVADGSTITFTDPTPITGTPARYYRVIQVP